MIVAWSVSAFRMPAIDLVIVGTDPIFSVLIAIPWKVIRPRTKIVHWCFDLYPEAAIADRKLRGSGSIATILNRLVRSAYSRCDVILDIGPCMRNLLARYASSARPLTVTPWALTEPGRELCTDTLERKAVFGDVALALMYSGNFGRAHSYEEVISLARALREKSIRFAFSVRGNRKDELRRFVSEEDTNVTFVPFAEEDRLDARLSAADIHVVTLRNAWTGSVVPSKFFGALAAGRPVLFVGSDHSSIAGWIKTHQVGWVLEPSNQSEIVAQLNHLSQHPDELAGLFAHCHRVYHQHFSKSRVIDLLEGEMRDLITAGKLALHRTAAEKLA
jgi:glycosyltransferase involved in cell wall biosynthesis